MFLVSLLFLVFAASAHALDVPKLQGYVNDYAGMISPPARSEIESELKSFEQTDSTQIVILTIPSLEGEAIEDFGIRVADAWKIGQKVQRQRSNLHRFETGQENEGRSGAGA